VIRRILKASAWVLGSIITLGIAAYGTAVAINWQDQEPSDAALQFAESYRNRPALADEHNAFIYVMGFTVPPGADPRSMGLKRVAWIQRRQETGASVDEDPLGEPGDIRHVRHPVLEQLIEACGPTGSGCNDAFAASDAAFAQLMASEGWRLQRYQTLIAHAGWRESVSFDLSTPVPDYGSILDGQRLLLLNARMLAKQGDHGSVKKLLGDDLRFWRRVLESSDSLITKMIATAALKRHFEWGNLVMKEFAPLDGALAMPAEWEAALTASERSLRRCLIGEWIFHSTVARSLSSESFYQPQDSINELAAHYSQLAPLLDAPLPDYQSALDQVRTATARREQQALQSPSPYNIVNRILIANISSDFTSYAARVNDIEGVRQAALAAVRLRERNVPPSEVAAALETAPFRNPYNDRPFTWDAEQGAIVFTGLQPGPRGEHRTKY
jgi:hypothetical protein